MADRESSDPGPSHSKGISRRDVIKGVIAAGAVSSGSYLFRQAARGPGCLGARLGRAADHAERQRPAAARGRA